MTEGDSITPEEALQQSVDEQVEPTPDERAAIDLMTIARYFPLMKTLNQAILEQGFGGEMEADVTGRNDDGDSVVIGSIKDTLDEKLLEYINKFAFASYRRLVKTGYGQAAKINLRVYSYVNGVLPMRKEEVDAKLKKWDDYIDNEEWKEEMVEGKKYELHWFSKQG